MPGDRIVRSAAVIPIARDDGTVLLDLGRGRRIALDAFGGRVWGMLDDAPTLALLVARVGDDESRPERVAEDVMRLLARWCELGVIFWR